MCVKNAMELSLNGETFTGLKEDFDSILEKTIGNMEKKGANEATVTLKLSISLDKEVTEFQDEDNREITKPTFKHEISSVMQVKDKKTGSLSGNYELVWDDDQQKYVVCKIRDNQIPMFDEDDDGFGDDDVEYVEGIPDSNENNPKLIEGEVEGEEEYDPAFDVETPFGWLRQFVGEELTIDEAMGNYSVRTKENKIILSSASNKDDPFYCPAEKLESHIGHTIVCVGYGGETLANISIECEDCCETLFSLDLDLDDDDIEKVEEETGEIENGEDFDYDEPEEE